MEKIIKDHLVGFGTLKDMIMLEEDYNGDFTDAGMTEIWKSAYDDTPSKIECDQICKKLSGEVLIINRK